MKQKTIGDRMRALREHYKDLGLTAKNICDYLQCSAMYLNNWENNKVKFNQEFLTKFAQALGSTYEWVAEGNGKMLPEGPIDVNVLKQGQRVEADSPWKNEAFGILKAENERLWAMVQDFMTGKVKINFLNPVKGATRGQLKAA